MESGPDATASALAHLIDPETRNGFEEAGGVVRFRRGNPTCVRTSAQRRARQSVRSDRLIASSAPIGPVNVSPVGVNPARRYTA